MVEADVGGDAAADPGPALLDLEDLDRVLAAADQIAAPAGERLARLLQPARGNLAGRSGEFDRGVPVLLHWLEYRVASKRGAPTARTVWEGVVLLKGQLGAAFDAEKGSGTGHHPG